MVAPMTSYPASTSNAAATDESTPPDIATRTRSLTAPLHSNAERGTWNAEQTSPALGLVASVRDRTFPFCSAFRLPRSALTSSVQHRGQLPDLVHDLRQCTDDGIHVLSRAVLPERKPQRRHAELARHAHRAEHVRRLHGPGAAG